MRLHAPVKEPEAQKLELAWTARRRTAGHPGLLPALAGAAAFLAVRAAAGQTGSTSACLAPAEPDRCLGTETKNDGDKKRQQKTAGAGADDGRDEDGYKPDSHVREGTRLLRTGHKFSSYGSGKKLAACGYDRFVPTMEDVIRAVEAVIEVPVGGRLVITTRTPRLSSVVLVDDQQRPFAGGGWLVGSDGRVWQLSICTCVKASDLGGLLRQLSPPCLVPGALEALN